MFSFLSIPADVFESIITVLLRNLTQMEREEECNVTYLSIPHFFVFHMPGCRHGQRRRIADTKWVTWLQGADGLEPEDECRVNHGECMEWEGEEGRVEMQPSNATRHHNTHCDVEVELQHRLKRSKIS